MEQCLSFLAAPPVSTPTARAGGAEVKVSPDGGLRQAATVADLVEVQFANENEEKLLFGDEDARRDARDANRALVPASYVEFVDRLPSRVFSATDRTSGIDVSVFDGYVPERLRRDGFETRNADAIFESTFRAQTEHSAREVTTGRTG